MPWTDAARNYFFGTIEDFNDRYCSTRLEKENGERSILVRLGAAGLEHVQADALVRMARATARRLTEMLPHAVHRSPGHGVPKPWLVLGTIEGPGGRINGSTRIGLIARDGQFFLIFRSNNQAPADLSTQYNAANRQAFLDYTHGHWQELPHKHLLLDIPITPSPDGTFPPEHPLSDGQPITAFLTNINNQCYNTVSQNTLQTKFFNDRAADIDVDIGHVIWPRLFDQVEPAEGNEIDQEDGPFDPERYPMNINTILYGPPGTGKTHSVTAIALSMIDGQALDNVPLSSLYSDAVIAGDATPYVSLEEWRTWHNRFDDLVRSGRVEVTTFHQNYSYEDFIEGLKAETLNGSVVYSYEMGTLKRIAFRALYAWITGSPSAGASLSTEEMTVVSNWLSSRELPPAFRRAGNAAPPYVLIIDEINRGNVARIFGELITLVEESKRARLPVEVEVGHQPIFATLPYTKSPFILPPNLFIIGTMNTADRSLIGLDAALRRRFEFIELAPKPDQLATINHGDQSVDLRQLLARINARIVDIERSQDHTIGHAYFYGVNNMQDLASAMSRKVIPQLREYFFDRPADIAQILSTNDPDLDFVDELGRTNRPSLTNPTSYQRLYSAPQ